VKEVPLLAILLLVAPAGEVLGQVTELRVRRAIEDGAGGLGQSVAGGSVLTGPANTTGGLGRFQLAVAVTGTGIEIENPARSTGELDFVLPTATATLALGITRGADVSTGLTGFGSVDLLARAGVLATREDIEETGRIYGLGARVGIVRDHLAVPAVSVTVLRTWSDDLVHGEADDVRYEADIGATSLRVDISKSFLLVTPYLGAGVDRTDIEASYTIPADRSTAGRPIEGAIDEEGSHGRVYGGVALNFLLLDVAVEAGSHESGAYGSVGARIGL